MRSLGVILLSIFFTGLGGCVNISGINDARDSGPSTAIDLSHVPDAIPRVEARTLAGNKSPYTVLGKTYHIAMDVTDYQDQGIASWYGRKFHGRKTSNGETYDMYAMTAAHKTLPIPCYVKVTNLDNGKQIVVRVNDRGPFHDGRIIDLSYAAAYRLGFAGRGTAPVEISLINPGRPARPMTLAKTDTDKKDMKQDISSQSLERGNTFVQAGAFSNRASAIKLRDTLAGLINYPVSVERIDSVSRLFKVWVGPIVDDLEFIHIRDVMMAHNLGAPHLVYE